MPHVGIVRLKPSFLLLACCCRSWQLLTTTAILTNPSTLPTLTMTNYLTGQASYPCRNWAQGCRENPEQGKDQAAWNGRKSAARD